MMWHSHSVSLFTISCNHCRETRTRTCVNVNPALMFVCLLFCDLNKSIDTVQYQYSSLSILTYDWIITNQLGALFVLFMFCSIRHIHIRVVMVEKSKVMEDFYFRCFISCN